MVFWNNPIVVSAFRVQTRRGALFTTTSIYVMLLVAGGGVLQYYQQRIPGPFPRNYLLGLLGVQFLLSALMAAIATGTSLRQEINKQTFDFQRIAALSPAQILAGKLLGVSAPAFLLAIAAVPLGAWCWMMGVEGVSLSVLLLCYLTVATNTLMFGCLGLVQRLTPEGERGPSRNRSGMTGWAIVATIFLPQAMANSGKLLSQPWSTALMGLATPVAIFHGVLEGNPWHHAFNFFGLQIPLLCLTPCGQLFIAWLLFQSMERAVVNPLANAQSKKLAYLICLAAGLLIAGVLFEPRIPGGVIPIGLTRAPKFAAFCLAHIVLSLWLTLAVTPGRDMLMSWIWRFREKGLSDLWLGERSGNLLALITFALFGLACYGLLMVLPDGLVWGWDWNDTQIRTAWAAPLLMTLLILSLGTFYQWCLAIGSRAGARVFWVVVILLTLPAHLFGDYYHLDFLAGVAPSAHFAHWIAGNRDLPLYLLAGVYGLLGAASLLAYRRRMAKRRLVVDQKLEQMGVSR
jgi:hypothetical protein